MNPGARARLCTRLRRAGSTASCASLALLLLPGLAACNRDPQPTAPEAPTAPHDITPTLPATRSFPPSPPLVRAARRQVGTTIRYDPAYASIPYPGGDVAVDRGVCTDVVIRALRSQGLDLQREIHVDRAANRHTYPAPRTALDRNIDHRRVPNQMAWFSHQGWGVPITDDASDYLPADIVAWRLNGSGLHHIGIVSDRTDTKGVPLVLHNISSGTREDQLLFEHPIIGHYRPPARYGTRVAITSNALTRRR